MKQRKKNLFVVFAGMILSCVVSANADETTKTQASEVGSYRKEGIDVVQGRLFRKDMRHEFSLDLGAIVDNQFLYYELIQPRYTFHLRENIGVELTYGFVLHQERQIIEALKHVSCDPDNNSSTPAVPCSVALDPPPDPLKNMYFANIVWSPIYGKFSIFSKKIYHFDVYILAGGGMFANERSNRFGFNIGVGSKIFTNDWFAVKVDFRNITVREGAPFNQIINNRIYSLGASVFLPTKPRKNT